jgi:hypothetical protein
VRGAERGEVAGCRIRGGVDDTADGFLVDHRPAGGVVAVAIEGAGRNEFGLVVVPFVLEGQPLTGVVGI